MGTPEPTPARNPGLFARAPGWILLGTSGSILLTVAGAGIVGGNVVWWFHPRFPGGHTGNEIGFYVGMAALAVAWLGLGWSLRTIPAKAGELWLVGALWCVPLLAGAPLFSEDVYSYLAQGTIAHLGLSPYREAPSVLGHLGQTRVLDAVYPFWRGVTAPYGPLFLGVVSLIAGAAGSNLVIGAVLVRLFELVGLVLLAGFVPRLARAAGADPVRAIWLTVLSPLVLLQLLAASHNDLLMVGLMVCGLALALERRPLIGIAVCALAATVKLPAALAVVFIAVTWARSQPDWARRWRVLSQALLVAGAVVALVSVVTGLGFGWISTSLFSIPAKVRLAVTPSTAIAWTVTSLLHDAGAAASFNGIESALRIVALAIDAAVVLALLARARLDGMPRLLGWALIAFAFGGPAAWPWYFSWGVVLLAATPRTQHSLSLVGATVLAAFLVKPTGIFAIPLPRAPIVLVCYLLLGGAAVYASRRRRRGRVAERAEPIPAGRPSALARSPLG